MLKKWLTDRETGENQSDSCRSNRVVAKQGSRQRAENTSDERNKD
jgi:hypothetical protein